MKTIISKTLYAIALMLFFTNSAAVAQEEVKEKELEWTVVLENKTFSGVYVGVVDRVDVGEKKRKAPHGNGYFKGRHDDPSGEVTVIEYNGAWLNGEMNGKGELKIHRSSVITYDNEPAEKYSGDFINNDFRGSGTITYEVFKYEGQVSGYKPQGIGKKIFRVDVTIDLETESFSVTSLEGRFDKGELAEGKLTIKTGEVLTGSCIESKFTGTGKVVFKDGSSYEGNWVTGLFEGKGIYIDKDGVQRDGNWAGGKIQGYYKYSNSKGLIMEGYDQDDKLVGSGKCSLSDGGLYEGEMIIKRDKIVGGKGKISYKNGDVLDATWDDFGVLSNGIRYFGITVQGDTLFEKGTFRNGNLTGIGQKGLLFKYDPDYDPSYAVYVGYFFDGQFSGDGKIELDDIRTHVTIEGLWTKDLLPDGQMTLEYFDEVGEVQKEVIRGRFINYLPKAQLTQYLVPLNEISIGSQIWSENLNFETFRNGDLIPEAKTLEEWRRAAELKQPAWCYFNNDSVNGAKYGKLYNWYAVNDPRGLAPDGFHIPTEDEWTQLSKYLGYGAGEKMKSSKGWKNNYNGNNSSGFSGLPGGKRESYGLFKENGSKGYWWSSTIDQDNPNIAYFRFLDYLDNSFSDTGHIDYLGTGMSVRCVKD